MRVRFRIGISVAMLAGCANPHSVSTLAPAPAACDGYDVDRSWVRAAPVYQPCDVDQPTTAIQRSPTGYHPLDCKNASATLRLVVDTTGTPEPRTIGVVQSTSTDFTTAAIRALRQWRYRPALKGGKKVRQVTRQRFDFQCQQVPQGRSAP